VHSYCTWCTDKNTGKIIITCNYKHTHSFLILRILNVMLPASRPIFSEVSRTTLRTKEAWSRVLNTYSMEQSPSWEASRFSASQEILCLLWNSKFQYRAHKSPPPGAIISQTNPVHAPTSHFLNINLNIILPSTPWYSKWSLSLTFPHQTPVYLHPSLESSADKRTEHR
jgi:hypothetical protein